MGEETPRGQSRPAIADLSSQEGWITTEVAARAVRVSPRTIRRYIEQGRLEAKLQGEGVRREWHVSVDSLHALRASRTCFARWPRDWSGGPRKLRSLGSDWSSPNGPRARSRTSGAERSRSWRRRGGTKRKSSRSATN